MRFAGQEVDGGGQGAGVLEVVLVERRVGRIGQATGGYAPPWLRGSNTGSERGRGRRDRSAHIRTNHVEPQRFPVLKEDSESCWRAMGFRDVHSLESFRNRSLTTIRACQGVDDARRVRRPVRRGPRQRGGQLGRGDSICCVPTTRHADDLIGELDRLATQRGHPAVLRCDNGPELACAAMAEWAGTRAGLCFIPPGEPWRNGYVESFNSRVRDECLNINVFWSLAQARVVISDRKREYNWDRPHSALNYRAPARYAANCIHR
jgi:hypothetical protein